MSERPDDFIGIVGAVGESKRCGSIHLCGMCQCRLRQEHKNFAEVPTMGTQCDLTMAEKAARLALTTMLRVPSTMIASVKYAMAVIQELGNVSQGLAISDLVRKTGIDKSVVSRIVATLSDVGYVEKDSRNDFVRLTLSLPALALRFLDRTEFMDQCLPVLQSIAGHTGDLVQLAVAGSGPPVYLATARGENRVQALPLTGTEVIPHASTVGKLWLASMNDRDARAKLGRGPLKSVSAKTNTDPNKILADVETTRRLGYSTIQGELSAEINAIAVPIVRDLNGDFIGALCLGVPAHRAGLKTLTGHLQILRHGAKTLAPILHRYLMDHGGEVRASVIRLPPAPKVPASDRPAEERYRKRRTS